MGPPGKNFTLAVRRDVWVHPGRTSRWPCGGMYGSTRAELHAGRAEGCMGPPGQNFTLAMFDPASRGAGHSLQSVRGHPEEIQGGKVLINTESVSSRGG